VRGWCARRHDRSMISRNAIPRDFSVVPDESGRTCTSMVARAGCSAARRAAIGPLTEALRTEQEGRKENLAELSTPSSPSHNIAIDWRAVDVKIKIKINRLRRSWNLTLNCARAQGLFRYRTP